MARPSIRLAIDEALWDAVKAAARVRGIETYAFVEEALTAALSPAETIQQLTALAAETATGARSAMASAAEMRDQIQVISDFIVDLYRAEARASGDESPM
jgi:hypothetical protein